MSDILKEQFLNDSGSVLVGYDFSNGKDAGVLIVGRRVRGGQTKIINAFQGEEAVELYEKLITPKVGPVSIRDNFANHISTKRKD